ncbi:MAG: S8 family serine peptidase, partial [Actinomycetota bacterium]|nr:S8 family serine peptidase [Actinomycetota bacterium]
MKKIGAGLLVFGAMASGIALTLPEHDPGRQHKPAWQPVVHGLRVQPARLLPAVVSQTRPVRVVSTSIDRSGRPVVSVGTATDHDTASALVVAGQRAPGAVSVEADVPVSVAAADPLLPAQWDLARVRADKAWPRSTGAGVTVAVIDSGVDSSHPDLAGHVLPGGDFITGTEGAAVDPHGHGTHVAGTIAALTGNGEGIAGMAPDAQILPVRVLDANGNGYMSDVANGIAYAADHGADVINLSVSATSQVGAVTNAIAYARSKGVVVVAAAGNARRTGSPTAFPAADPGVLAVAATASDDSVAGYSNRGGYVDVAAPGSDITSTYPGNRYVRMNGTSMAAPHVSALAALLKGADRTLTPDQVEQAVTASAVDLGEPGRDLDFGAGRIDAPAALATLSPVRPSPSE